MCWRWKLEAGSRQRTGHWNNQSFCPKCFQVLCMMCNTYTGVCAFLMVFVYWQGLEHLQWYSVCVPGQYNWMKKIQLMLVWLRKMVLAPHNSTWFWLCLVKGGTSALCICRKECTKIWSNCFSVFLIGTL
jgi:hypothetical protein